MLNLKTDAEPTSPLTVWIRDDLTRGREGDGTEVTFHVRVMLSGDQSAIDAIDENSTPDKVLPRMVVSVDGLSLDGDPSPDMTPELAAQIPVWAANAIATKFSELNTVSEEEEGN